MWRWWHEDMLDCCIPLDDAKRSGITLDEFVCLALCQGVLIMWAPRPPRETRRSKSEDVDGTGGVLDVAAEEKGDGDENGVAAFRRAVAASCHSGDNFVVVSYNRKVLAQTGSGHFSPIGAYDPVSDKVLILDVARFKYPPHWVQLELLWEAMRSVDSATQRPRGWVVMTKSPQVPLLVKCAPLRTSC